MFESRLPSKPINYLFIMKNQKKMFGTANANAIVLTAKVTQTSISKKDGIELTNEFTKDFKVAINLFSTTGQALNRINSVLFYQITEGKRSGKLKGLNLKYPFSMTLFDGRKKLFSTDECENWDESAKLGLTSRRQQAFGRAMAEQLKENYLKYNDSMFLENEYTLDDADAIRRELLSTNIVEMVDTLIDSRK